MNAQEARAARAGIEAACRLLIERLLDDCDARLARRVPQPDDAGYLASREQVDRFYTAGREQLTYPGRNRLVRSAGNGLELWFRVECDQRPFAGVCVYDAVAHGLICFEDIPEETKQQLYGEFCQSDDTVAQDCWWLRTFFLPDGDVATSPNFLLLDDRALALLDEDAYEGFLEAATEQIDAFCARWLNI